MPSCCSLVVPVAMGRARRRFGGMAPGVRGVRQDAGVSLFGISLLEVDACPGPGPGPGPGPKKSHSYYHVSPPHLHPAQSPPPKNVGDSSPINREKSTIILVLTYYYPLHASPTPPQSHNWPTFDFFFGKRGTPFFADRPPRSSYRPRRVESKGASGIPGQPITLRFVGYPTFAGRPCG